MYTCLIDTSTTRVLRRHMRASKKRAYNTRTRHMRARHTVLTRFDDDRCGNTRCLHRQARQPARNSPPISCVSVGARALPVRAGALYSSFPWRRGTDAWGSTMEVDIDSLLLLVECCPSRRTLLPRIGSDTESIAGFEGCRERMLMRQERGLGARMWRGSRPRLKQLYY